MCETGNITESIILSENELKCKHVNPIHFLPMHLSKPNLQLYISFTAVILNGMLNTEHQLSRTHTHTHPFLAN